MNNFTDDVIKEWIYQELLENDTISYRDIREEFGIGGYRTSRLLNDLVNENVIIKNDKGKHIINPEYSDDIYEEVVEETISENKEPLDEDDEKLYVKKIASLNKSLQRARDENRLLRAQFRNNDRMEYRKEIVKEELSKHMYLLDKPLERSPIIDVDNSKVIIIQLSDLHFGETVKSIDTKGSNVYNWEIASKRLQKYACECVKIMQNEGVSEVIIGLTGDLMNSDRRKDEIVRNSESRCVTAVGAVDLLSYFLDQIYEYADHMTIVSVFGNESRVPQDIGSIYFEDNFDYLIHEMLDLRMQNYINMDFIPPKFDHSTVIQDVLGANILLIHGHNRTNFKDELEKYAHDPIDPIIIHYMLTGHYHSTFIKNGFRRSASLVGSNAYSYHKMGIHGTAEQTVHILIKEDPKRCPVMRSIPINLDVVKEYDGYPIIQEKLPKSEDFKDFEKVQRRYKIK